MSLPASKPTRNADLRHAQSLGHQRKAAGATPHEQAMSIAAIIRKRLSDGQPVPDLDRYGLTDAVWAELLDILDADELGAVGDACRGNDLEDESEPSSGDLTRVFEDDVPLTPEPPAPQQTPQVAHVPSWRNHEPPIVHSLKWHDADSIEHLHVIRADTLDEALVHVKKLKLCIAAAKAKSPSPAVNTKAPGSISPRRCEIHDAEMTRRVSKKTGKLYSAHQGPEGLCFGRQAS
jgi:hypothetical protein